MALPFHSYPVQLIQRLLRKSPPLAWLLYDAAASLVVLWCLARAAVTPQPPPLIFSIAATVFVLTGGCVFGLYEKHILIGRINLALVLAETAATGYIASLVVAHLFGVDGWGWFRLLEWIASASAVLLAPRLAGSYALRSHKIKVLAVADPACAERIAQHLRRESECYVLVGYCNDEPFPFGVAKPLDSLARIPEACSKHDVDIVVVNEDFLAKPIVINSCLMAARLGCEVHSEESFLEGFLERLDPDSFDRGAVLQASFADKQPFALLLKRLLDIAAASAALLLASWLMALIYLVSRLSSRDSVFYLQERCGLFGKPFRIIKFRTMRADAEKDGPVWAVRGDPRTTRLGRFLRTTHLDELPQFWNILKGNMSFVGPRPERPEMARKLEESVPSYAFRHWVRPGLTGLAQIRFRYSNTVEDARTKLQYDLFYLKNWSLIRDALIVLRTIAILARGSW
jgi:exopolysaccharide biosynthesis polyprenyl glycosylphosphotransferase